MHVKTSPHGTTSASTASSALSARSPIHSHSVSRRSCAEEVAQHGLHHTEDRGHRVERRAHGKARCGAALLLDRRLLLLLQVILLLLAYQLLALRRQRAAAAAAHGLEQPPAALAQPQHLLEAEALLPALLLPPRLCSKQARLEAARRRPLIRLAVALRVAAPAIVRIVQPAALLLGVHLHVYRRDRERRGAAVEEQRGEQREEARLRADGAGVLALAAEGALGLVAAAVECE
eukprot:scaffold12248_cov66-Phaeocystis_antarctica.AAC.3